MELPPESFNDLFLSEAEEMLDAIEELVLDIETNGPQQESLDQLFRVFHTLKGSGSMFGFQRVADLTHHLESALDLARDGKLPLDRPLLELILSCRDYLQRLVSSQPPPESEDAPLVERIKKAYLAPSSATAEPKEAAHAAAPDAPFTLYHVRYRPGPETFAHGSDPAGLIDDLLALGEGVARLDPSTLPPFLEAEPEKCALSWEALIASEHSRAELLDPFLFEDEAHYQLQALEPLDAPLDQASLQARFRELEAPQGEPAEKPTQNQAPTRTEAPAAAEATSSAAESLRVASSKLDRLVNLVGELVVNQAQLNRLSEQLESAELQTTAEEAERLIDELRDNVLGIRMTPVGASFQRLRRLVRDLSAELDKSIRLECDGGQTELDKTVLDQLTDPLVHLLRNCCDHAIEAPEQRLAANKPAEGTVSIDATQQGSQVVLTIRDDGRGIDRKRLVEKATEKGLLAPDAALSQKEQLELIFHPGLSTANAVSAISGRGVGMDAVKRKIESLRGRLEIESEPGLGTTVRLFIPLTLSIIEGLLVSVGPDFYILPVELVTETIELEKRQRLANNQRNLIESRGEAIPYLRLRELFDEGEDGAPEIELTVILEQSDRRIGLVVDKVLGTQQTVIKSVGKLCDNLDCLAGASIMGDGRVALILDLQGLVARDAKRRAE